MNDLERVLNSVRAWFDRFITVTESGDLDTITLWAAHTWALDCTATTPRLLIDSSTPGSGKTTLMEHLNALCFQPLLAASLSSPALLTRVLDKGPRTILVDEVDRTLDPKRDGVGDLLAVINAGYKRGATRPVLVPAGGGNWEPKEFPTYAPVAMAGNAPLLPDDTRSRCTRVLLMPDFADRAEETDWEVIDGEATALRDALAACVEQATEQIAVRPELPQGCRGRMAEKWRPLARIAHAAGGEWIEKVNAAIIRDVAETQQEREDGMTTERPAVVLLRHLAETWPDDAPFIPTKELVDALIVSYPDMWGASSAYGKDLTSQRLGRLLSQGFKIHASKLNGVRGYRRASFTTAWGRFGLYPSAQTVQTVLTAQTGNAVDGLESSQAGRDDTNRPHETAGQGPISQPVDGLDGLDSHKPEGHTQSVHESNTGGYCLTAGCMNRRLPGTQLCVRHSNASAQDDAA